MQSKPHNLTWILIAIVFLSILAAYVNSFSPNSILLLVIFFLLVGAMTFFTSLFFLNNVRRAGLLSLGFSLLLILRYLNLREPIYLILLSASLLSLELLLRNK